MDALSRLLWLHPVRAALDIRCRFGQDWHLPHDAAATGAAPYHFVLEGHAWLSVEGAAPLALQAGDLVVLARGASHCLYTAPAELAAPVHVPGGAPPGAVVSLRVNGGSAAAAVTDFLCGQFEFESPQSNLLLQALPEVLLVRGGDVADEAVDGDAGSALRALAGLLRQECGGLDGTGAVRAGAQAVVAGLASALFGLALRGWLRQDGPTPGLLALLAHARLHKAVQVMLDAPEQDWSLTRLAEACHLSRATFARQFRQVAASTPGEVLLRLRMARAAHLLRHGKEGTAEIGEAVGYQSEAAFSRVFKKINGIGPGAYRRQMRGRAAQADAGD